LALAYMYVEIGVEPLLHKITLHLVAAILPLGLAKELDANILAVYR
jgi:hypothetical protein